MSICTGLFAHMAPVPIRSESAFWRNSGRPVTRSPAFEDLRLSTQATNRHSGERIIMRSRSVRSSA